MTQFGSGWCWLAVKDGKITVTKTANGENPLVHGAKPILGCDVWEHSYYIDYRNRRPDYLKAFLDHLVNWDHVAEMYDGGETKRGLERCGPTRISQAACRGLRIALNDSLSGPVAAAAACSRSSRRDRLTPGDILDRLAVAVLAASSARRAAHLSRLWVGWDDYAHAEYGDLLVGLMPRVCATGARCHG